MPVTAGRRTFLLPASPSLHPRTATAGLLLGNHKQRRLARDSLGMPATPQLHLGPLLPHVLTTLPPCVVEVTAQ